MPGPRRVTATVTLCCAVGLVTACGGGGGGGGDGEEPAPIAGLWLATASGPGLIEDPFQADSGLVFVALIRPDGQLHMGRVTENALQFTGTLGSSSGRVTGGFQGVIGARQPNSSFPIHGSLDLGRSAGQLQGSWTFDEDWEQRTASITFVRRDEYGMGASLASVGGTWPVFTIGAPRGTFPGAQLVIDGDGMLVLTDTGTTCVAAGEVVIPDERYNVYDVSLSYSNCPGGAAMNSQFEGSSFSGFMFRVPDVLVQPANELRTLLYAFLVGEVNGIPGSIVWSGSRP